MANEKTIVLAGDPRREEWKGSAKITPGHLLEFDSNGEVTTHATAGGNRGPALVAVEQEWLGKEIGNQYAVGDLVQVAVPGKGNVFNMLLAIGNNVKKGNALESAGDGTLRLHTVVQADSNGSLTDGQIAYADNIVGYAREDVDTTGASSTSRLAVYIA